MQALERNIPSSEGGLGSPLNSASRKIWTLFGATTALFRSVTLMPNFYLVRRCWMAAGLLVVCTARTQAASACPDWVTTPAGSAFNIAALIADNGSPQAALEKVRDSLARVVKGGGCGTFVEPAACDEPVELAK